MEEAGGGGPSRDIRAGARRDARCLYWFVVKELRSFSSDFEARNAAGLLQARGILCEVRNKALSEEPELWVLGDADLLVALGVLREGGAMRARAWVCPNCKSENEAQFDTCWSCGSARG
jgi:hypothetical protein